MVWFSSNRLTGYFLLKSRTKENHSGGQHAVSYQHVFADPDKQLLGLSLFPIFDEQRHQHPLPDTIRAFDRTGRSEEANNARLLVCDGLEPRYRHTARLCLPASTLGLYELCDCGDWHLLFGQLFVSFDGVRPHCESLILFCILKLVFRVSSLAAFLESNRRS